MGEGARSEQACPVCGRHALALDQPPHIDIMGVQSYSDMLGMGDLPQQGALGIVCLDCGTRWRDQAAFDRGDAEPEDGGEDVDAEAAWDDGEDGRDAAEDGLGAGPST